MGQSNCNEGIVRVDIAEIQIRVLRITYSEGILSEDTGEGKTQCGLRYL